MFLLEMRYGNLHSIVVAYKDQGWHCCNEYFMVIGFLGVIASEARQSLGI